MAHKGWVRHRVFADLAFCSRLAGALQVTCLVCSSSGTCYTGGTDGFIKVRRLPLSAPALPTHPAGVATTPVFDLSARAHAHSLWYTALPRGKSTQFFPFASITLPTQFPLTARPSTTLPSPPAPPIFCRSPATAPFASPPFRTFERANSTCKAFTAN